MGIEVTGDRLSMFASVRIPGAPLMFGTLVRTESGEYPRVWRAFKCQRQPTPEERATARAAVAKQLDCKYRFFENA